MMKEVNEELTVTGQLTPNHLTPERVHNAGHKNVTSALNTTFFKTSGL